MAPRLAARPATPFSQVLRSATGRRNASGARVWHTETVDRSDLLEQLRRDRTPAAVPRRRGRRALLALLVLLLLAGAGWLVAARATVPTVRTAVAKSAGGEPGAGSVLDASGYVTARRQATVSAKVTGKVVEVLIEEGQRVKEGDVLARLDDTEARAQLSLNQSQLTLARSQVAEIQAMLAQAERDFVRQSDLFARQLVSEQSLDAARAQRDMLRARLASSREQIMVAQESVDMAKVQLDNTVVRAPFAGVVIAKSAQPGEMISPLSAGGGFTRTGIGTIVDMDSLEIQVDVNESFINRVASGQPVEATLNAYPEWKIPGEVIAIIPTADRSKATVKVRIAIKSRDRRIVPDMGVRVSFLEPAGTRPAASVSGVIVPAEAVRVEGQGKTGLVFVVAAEAVQRRPVTLGAETAAGRQILSGLREGERVVLSPPESLRDGAAVKLADRP
jgi:RND family efflux transporter MFP subunit